MNGTSLLAKACAAALLCSGAAWAENAAGLLDSSKLDDKKVTDLQGSELGEIERLLVDPQTGQVRFAVLEVKTPSQPQAETEVAVPWQALKVQREGTTNDFKIQLDATKDKLDRAPRFSEAEVDRLWSPEGSKQVFSYWAVTWTESTGSQAPSGTTALPPSTSGQQPPSTTSGTVSTPESSQPSVTTPSDQGGPSSGPGSYYQKNRPSTESSATEQNNYPAGQQRETPPGTISTPESSASPAPAPSTTPPTSSTSPTDTSESKPAGPSSGSTDSSTTTPSEPSTIP